MTDTQLPSWSSVLAVVAHPDDESFGLGAVLSTFAANGAQVTVVCFTHGEASTVHEVEGNLASVRAAELTAAALELGIDAVHLKAYPDGALGSVDPALLVADVERVAETVNADGFIAFDPSGVTSHPDHQCATAVALIAAAHRQTDLLGWTIPETTARLLTTEFGAEFVGHNDNQVDVRIDVDRARQIRAIACHPSQVVPGSVLWRRLELLGSSESLRWLLNSRPQRTDVVAAGSN